MSIDIMSFLKRWKRYVICIIIILLFLLGMSGFFTTKKTALSSTTLERIQEKIPYHPYIRWQETLHHFQSYTQVSSSKISYTLHPALFDSQRSTGNQLLSGQLTLNITRQEPLSASGMISFDLALSGFVQGIREQDTLTTIALNTQLQGIIYGSDMYFKIDAISLSQTGNISDTLSLWSIMLQQYKDTWIRTSLEDIAAITLLSPRMIQNMIEKNARQLRLLPSVQGGGWAYTISGSHLSITGDWQSTTDNTLHIRLPQHDIISHITHTHVADIWDIAIEQYNDYAGNFAGTLQQHIGRNKLSRIIKGEATRPGGIWADIDHTITIKRSPAEVYTPPTQFLERETMKQRWTRQ